MHGHICLELMQIFMKVPCVEVAMRHCITFIKRITIKKLAKL